MKILIINASPRPQGNLSKMLEAMRVEAIGAGVECECVSVSHLQVAPCVGCMACRQKGACILPEDDSLRVLRLMQWCDVMVVGAPCYWGNMPGTLKLLFDRLVYGLMQSGASGLPKPLHQGKKAIVVSTCTTSYPFNIWFNQSRGTVNAVKEILKWSGFKVVKCIERGGTHTSPVGEKDLARCRRLVRRLIG